MRPMLYSIFALTTLVAALNVYGQTGEVEPAPGTAIPPRGPVAGEINNEKKTLLRLLDHAQSLAKWMPNESPFLTSLNKVQGQVGAAATNEFAPLSKFEPHLSHMEATLSRIEARASSMGTAADICDPARKTDLFLLFLDTLDMGGQRELNARICERIASEEKGNESLAQVCIASTLWFGAAKSMQDLVVACDPSLRRPSSDATAARFDQLSSELADTRARVQASVRSAEHDLTQAMTVVAGHVAEVSSAHTAQLEASLVAERNLDLRFDIEKALQQASPYGSLYLPQANGGQLELVRTIVIETVQNVTDSGESANDANTKVAEGDKQYTHGHYKKAFRLYSEAYRAAVGNAGKR